MTDKFQDVLNALIANNGACLYWQMPHGERCEQALAAGIIKADGELLVHPDAIMIKEGMAYRMP